MMDFKFLLIVIFISAISILIGLFIFLNPSLAIEIQKQFYAKINWRIEPISVPKEIRNTKIMGLFLIILGLLAIGRALIK
jgi:hypothetical protein